MNDTSSIPATIVSHSGAGRRKVLAATVIGTTVEWYDFFIYASISGTVLANLFFAPAGPEVAVLVGFLSSGIGFVFRPLGAFLAGYLGDRYGRKFVLALTLILMGTATTTIGLLPTYAQIGIAAPIILILLRIVQGISAGGEWGGAVLLAVEHAPVEQRGFWGAAPQIGIPLGLLLCSGMLALMSVIAPGQAFLEWGWRVPFLASVVLILIGRYVRRRVDESPVFEAISARKQVAKSPISTLFRRHALVVIIAAVVLAGSNGPGYMVPGGFLQRYATDPNGIVGLEIGPVMIAVTISSAVWLVMTLSAGALSDKIGRKRTFMLGWILQAGAVLALFPLVETGDIWMFTLGVSLLSGAIGVTVGPLSTLFSELFPSSVRFSGIAISHAIGAVLGGAFAPFIAQWLLITTGTSTAVMLYLLALTLIGFTATLLLRDRTGIPLGAEHELLQAKSPIHGMK